MSHRALGFCPHGRRNHRANAPGVRARGTCKTPTLAQMNLPPSRDPHQKGLKCCKKEKLPCHNRSVNQGSAKWGQSLCTP